MRNRCAGEMAGKRQWQDVQVRGRVRGTTKIETLVGQKHKMTSRRSLSPNRVGDMAPP